MPSDPSSSGGKYRLATSISATRHVRSRVARMRHDLVELAQVRVQLDGRALGRGAQRASKIRTEE